MNPVPDEAANLPTSRREWAIAMALIGCGVAVRLWVVSRSAVEHFDEGVYASNLYFGEPEFAYPMQHLYAPPLLPSLIEAGMIAGLPPNVAAVVPSLLAGCGTLLAVWRIGRRWFGPAAGIAALALACLSDFHIAYSGAALTDVLLALFVLLAVGATSRAIAWTVGEVSREPIASASNTAMRHSTRKRGDKSGSNSASANPNPAPVSSGSNAVDKWGVIAGLLTAAAWWTKYNGWLPLAIAAAGTVLLMILSGAARSRWKGSALVLALIGATAAVAWSPVPLALGDVGGYWAVAANHANYVVGPGGWLGAAGRQIANQSAMEGLLSWSSIGIAMLCAWLLAGRGRAPSGFGVNFWGLLIPGLLMLAAVVESAFVVLLVLCVASVVGQGIAYVRNRDAQPLAESQIGFCLLVAWFGGLIVATPNYWPYPRLVLPLLVCLWILAGRGLAIIAEKDKIWPATAERYGSSQAGWVVVAGLVAAIPLAFLCRAPIAGPAGSLGLDRNGMREAAIVIAGRIQQDLQQDGNSQLCFIFVQGEPAIVFQLRALGFPYVQPSIAPPEGPMMFENRPIATYFIYGPHASRDPQFVAGWERVKPWFSDLTPPGVESRPSPIVLLDSHDPRTPVEESGRIWLLRSQQTRPAETSPQAGDSLRKSGFDTSAGGRYSSPLPPEERTSVAHGDLPVPRPIPPYPADDRAELSTDQPSVLLIDSSAEEREVLRFALQRRGLRIFEADEAEAGLRLVQQYHPRVIVLDLESEAADREDLRAKFDAASAEHQSSLVILGRARRYDALPREQVLAKPYHFAPLVQTIEQLAAKAA